jgi:integrase
MANPSYWVFRRRQKWHSGWRDGHGHCHSKAHPIGAGKALASEYARKMAVEACQVRAGQAVGAKDIRLALELFLSREDVKGETHALNRRHLEALIGHQKLETVEELTEDLLHLWLGHLKRSGSNPGGQSLSLRILRTFCRFCVKKRWLAVYPFGGFKIPKSEFVGRYLSAEERSKLLSINPRYEVDRHLNRALTFGLYSLLRVSQVFHTDWSQFKAPDQLWVPGIKGQEGRWIRLHPKALEAMGTPKETGSVFDRWESLPAFREAVYKKAKRERLYGVRFHETKHTGISALLEAGYSVPEVCKISGNSYRTISHYAHVNEQRVFEKWKSFDYSRTRTLEVIEDRTAAVQQKVEKEGPNRASEGTRGEQGENTIQRQIATNSSRQTRENLSRGGAAW